MVADLVELEARAYGPDSTPEEIAAIRGRCELHAEGILIWRELPVMTPFTVDLCVSSIDEMATTHGCQLLIVDTRGGARVDAKLRKCLREGSDILAQKITRLAVVTDTTPLLRVAARFVQAVMPMPMTVHDTIEQAEEALRRAGA